jgi:hypothetical protein
VKRTKLPHLVAAGRDALPVEALYSSPHPEERPLGRVSKDEASSWFETALKKRLLTMRTVTVSPDE